MAKEEKPKSLIYLTNTVHPSWRAGSLHVKFLALQFKRKLNDFLLVCQVDTSQKQDEFLQEVSYTGVPVIKVPGKLIVLLVRFFFKLARQKRSVVYSRFSLSPLVIGRHKYILEYHSNHWGKGTLERLAAKKFVKDKRAIALVSISKTLAIDFKKQFPDFNKPVVVIEDAAEPAPEEYQPTFRNTSALNMAYIGSFHKGKGLRLIIELAKEVPHHNFLIYGGRDHEVKKMKESYDLPNLDFKGFVDQGLLWKEMSEIDICLLPNQPSVKTGEQSDIGKYTSPLKMFEYMAYSKPIISSDLKVLREVLDEEISVLVPHDDMRAWIDAIERLKGAEPRRTVGEAAYKRFIQNYTWERRSERILSLAFPEKV